VDYWLHFGYAGAAKMQKKASGNTDSDTEPNSSAPDSASDVDTDTNSGTDTDTESDTAIDIDSDTNNNTDSDTDSNTDSATDTESDFTPPVPVCQSPVSLYDTTSATAVIGTGTPTSCTETALRTAATQGGIITFNCGPDPVTIDITETIELPSHETTPELGDISDNGGATPTFMPGSTVSGIGADCPATDQRGESRNTSTCAAGAVEP
jgi:hypothetical protein